MNSVVTHARHRHDNQRLDEMFLDQFLCGFYSTPPKALAAPKTF
jgi:hypothetical protein